MAFYVKNDPIQLNASYLHLEFSRIADRFVHRLCWQTPDGLLAMLESVPGNSQQPWPSDPPLQQVVCESMGPGQIDVALGVGMSGQGHWSVAVEPLASPKTGWRWDWACKIRGPATLLGCTYRLVSPWSVGTVQDQPDACVLQHPDGHAAHWIVETGRMIVEPQHSLIRVEPIADLSVPGTIRWRYTIESHSH